MLEEISVVQEISIAQLIADFGFPVVMVVGLGYFVYYIWTTVNNSINPAVEDMKMTIIRLTDQLRLLDQDMIRIQTKVNTVLKNKNKEIEDEKKQHRKTNTSTRTRKN